MAALRFLEKILQAFSSCFSRSATFKYFVTVICGLLVRRDHVGATSIVRGLNLPEVIYERIIRFFRSTAYKLNDLKRTWYRIIAGSPFLYKFNGRNLILGDGTKIPKEGRYMPGVKRLHQESEDSSKGELIFGHFYGCISAVLGKVSARFACPLDMTIQEGLKATASWDGSEHSADTHSVQIVKDAYSAAQQLGKSYLVLDRLFFSVPVLTTLDELNAQEHLIDIVTRARKNVVAYEEPEPVLHPTRGRPRKKGEAVRLNELFETAKDRFVQAEVMMYGEKQQVQYLCCDLLWGAKLYRKLRFVLVKSSCRGNAILVSTDLSLSPEQIIEAYSVRMKIERFFLSFKQELGGFCYRFWTKAQPKLHRYKKKKDPDPLEAVDNPRDREKIIDTVRATECFVLCSCIATGIAQMMALTPSIAKTALESRYLRTKSKGQASEATIMYMLSNHFYQYLLLEPESTITQIIRSLQVRKSSVKQAS